MRLLPLVLSTLAMAGLCACNSAEGPNSRSGIAETFDTSNYRRSSDTNGTQTRRDVNRLYTQPSLPSISSRGN